MGPSISSPSPLDSAEMLTLLGKALERRRLLAETSDLKRQPAEQMGYGEMLGGSPTMRRGVRAASTRSPRPTPTSLSSGRERHGQGAGRQRRPRQEPARPGAPDQDQLRRAARRTSSSPNSSGTSRAPSLAPPRTGRASSKRPTRALSSSTRSRRCRRTSRPSSCACWKTGACGAWAAAAPCPSISGSFPRRTATPRTRSATAL